MTPKQLKESNTRTLIIVYQHKARCFYTEDMAEKVYKELEYRLGSDRLYGLRLETWHMQHGEGCETFDEGCLKLLNQIT